jgi:hypothetical protein
MWHEDFGDEPSVEERIKCEMSQSEIDAVEAEAFQSTECCGICGKYVGFDNLIETGYSEYVTMDLDPQLVCPDCLELRCIQYTPSDPNLWDVLTPICI